MTVLLLIVFQVEEAVSQTCCSGGIPLSNSIGLPIADRGIIQLGLQYDYNHLNRLNSGDEHLDDNSRLRQTHSILFNLGYSITDRLSVEGMLTWVNQVRDIRQFGNNNIDETTGIGDGIFLVRYRIGSSRNVMTDIGLGTKIPMGSSTEKNALGITLNADLQPGSNAWDMLYWSSVTHAFKERPSAAVGARLIYRATGTNKEYFDETIYKFGNELLVLLSYSDQFVMGRNTWHPGISFKYRNAGHDEIGGNQLENTGGNWVSFLPGMSVRLSPYLQLSLTGELPVYSNVDGTQLTPSYRITSGLNIQIDSNKKPLNFNQ